MSRNHFLLLCLLFTTLCAASQSFTVDQVLSATFPSELVAAKKVPTIAWVFNIKGERNLWVASAGDNFAPHQVTHYSGDDGQEIDALSISADGKFLVYARGSEVNTVGRSANPTGNVKPPKQQVFSLSTSGGEPKLLGDMGCEREGCEEIAISPDGKLVIWVAKNQLWLAPIDGSVAAKQLTDLRGRVSQPEWSPDGQHIAFTSTRQDHSFVALFDTTPEAIRYLAPTADRDQFPHWSPDGKWIAFVRRPGIENRLPLIPERPDPWAILLADANTGQARELWHSSSDPNGSLPSFEETSFKFATSDRLLFDSEQDGRNHLYSISTSGGQPALLTPGDFDVEHLFLAPDGKTVVFSSNQDDVDRRHIWRIAVAGGKPQAVTHSNTIEWDPVMTSDGRIFCLGSDATTPGLVYSASDGRRELLSPHVLPREFPTAALVTPQQVIFKSEDGYTIHGQLFVPKNIDRSKPASALIFTHGGPPRQMLLGFHYMQYYHNAYAANQYLANKGYVVLSVNYRLGIMYGRAFRRPPNSGWRGGNEYKDVVAGAKYLMSLPYVDKNRVGLWGGSYGGYLTAMGLAHNSDIFKAGVDYHGVHDWSARIVGGGDQDASLAPPDIEQARELAFNSSPVAAISSWKSPVLLIHGDDDRNVNFNQTVDLVARLRRQKVELEQMIIPDEIHDLLLWKDWVRSYAAMGEFFDRKLKTSQ